MHFANRLLESFTMIVMVAVWALASVVGLGCTFGAHDYPAPPRIGTQRQQQELANCARDALAESYPSRRLARLVELREVVAQIARSADTSETARDAMGRFLAETAYVVILNGDHARGRGGIGSMPSEVTDMPQRVPEEMVALRITEPRHWVEALYPMMTGSGGLPADMVRAAGGFETYGAPYPAFDHLSEVLQWTAGKEISASTKYDGLIAQLLSTNRLAAALRLLQIERPAFPTGSDFEEFLKIREQMLEVEANVADMHFRHLRATSGSGSQTPSFPFDESIKRMLLQLADRPEWSIHLFVISYMRKGTDWYDQEIIDRIAARANPVSMRFLAAKGMIDPALVPQPAKDPYETPSGARVIPSSRATSRPAATGPD